MGLTFSLKNRFSCLMTLIELVQQGNAFYYLLFINYLLISNYIAIIIYALIDYNLRFYHKYLFFAFHRILSYPYSFGREFFKLEFHVKHEAVYLGEESWLGHICKQIYNKFEVRYVI